MKHIIILTVVLVAAGLGWNHLYNLSDQNEQVNLTRSESGLSKLEKPQSMKQDNSAITKDLIQQRQQMMKNFAKRIKLIKALTDDEKVHQQEIVRLAAAITADAQELLALFPRGTSYNDLSDPKTSARPEIWTEYPKFQSSIEQFIFEADRLEQEARGTGEMTAVSRQLTSLGRNGCANCHLSYRRRD